MAKRHKRARAPKRTLESISTFIINLSTRGGGITHGKLQLILFYVQAVSLAQQGRPMFEEDFIADTQGPILRSIRARYAHHGTEPIPHTETADAVPSPSPSPTRRMLGPILASFGAQTESTLREIACAESPWLEARTRVTNDDEEPTIDKRTMSTFYRQRNADAAAAKPTQQYSPRL